MAGINKILNMYIIWERIVRKVSFFFLMEDQKGVC